MHIDEVIQIYLVTYNACVNVLCGICVVSSGVIILFNYFVFVLLFMKFLDLLVTEMNYRCDSLNLRSASTYRVAWCREIRTAKSLLYFRSSCMLCGSVWALKQRTVETVLPRLHEFCHATIRHHSVLLFVSRFCSRLTVFILSSHSHWCCLAMYWYFCLNGSWQKVLELYPFWSCCVSKHMATFFSLLVSGIAFLAPLQVDWPDAKGQDTSADVWKNAIRHGHQGVLLCPLLPMCWWWHLLINFIFRNLFIGFYCMIYSPFLSKTFHFKCFYK